MPNNAAGSLNNNKKHHDEHTSSLLPAFPSPNLSHSFPIITPIIYLFER